MRTQQFEAVVERDDRGGDLPTQATLLLGEQKAVANLQTYGPGPEPRRGRLFVRVTARRPLTVKWRDSFAVIDAATRDRIARGTVLNPAPPKGGTSGKEVDWDFLRALTGGEMDMLAALCRKKGTSGLHEREAGEFSGLSEEGLLQWAERLEAEGQVKILSFSPLHLISRERFDHLGEKILAYVEQFHERQPAQKGVLLEKVKTRFDVSDKVLRLAVRTLEKTGRLRLAGPRLMLPSHEAALSSQEEKILASLEDMCYRGEFQSVSLEEVRRRFRLSRERLEKLLSLLTERKKIIQGPEGLFIHARWLDDVIGRIRGLGKREMTVTEFKDLTGLSRKYAIPLLELLDQMGVTRRRGPVREILDTGRKP
jgi:selenocysteine-specific elongation factor